MLRAEGWKVVKGVLQYRGLLYVSQLIRSGEISCHHNNYLVGHFDIDKTRELIGRKYLWPSLRKDVETYVRGCDVCQTSNAICHKSHKDLQSLPIPTHRWNKLFIDFVTSFSLSTN